MIEPYSARQAKEISNAEQKFAQLREIEQKARSFKGTMTYRKTKGHNYLVRWFYDEERKENSTRRKRQVAALSGLAPITRQSGTWQGKNFIRGGRTRVRKMLYMPALCAIRFNKEF
jgi:hypothetical protein